MGQTGDLEKRLIKHNTGQSIYTRKGKGFWEIIHSEKFINKRDALQIERKIKGRGIKRYLEGVKKNETGV